MRDICKACTPASMTFTTLLFRATLISKVNISRVHLPLITVGGNKTKQFDNSFNHNLS